MTTPDPSDNEIDDLLPKRIRALRKNLGITTRQLETMAGLPTGALGRMERGTRRIYANDLYRIAQATERSLSYFYDPNDEHRESDPHRAERDRLLSAFGRIQDKRLRRDVFELVEALAKPPTR